jgi:integrase
MKKRAWVNQKKSQVDKHGADNASWYVNWKDPDGRQKCRSCGAGTRGKRDAERLADTIHSQLVTGTYETKTRRDWEQFRADFESKILAGSPRRSREVARQSLDTFTRIVKPNRIDTIGAEEIDTFISKRKGEPGRNGNLISPATINRELRYIRAMLRVANDWGDLKQVPRVRFLKQAEKLPTFVPPEHFAAIYEACEHAQKPHGIPNVQPADWWRALLAVAYTTGWRIGQIMAMKWANIDLEKATALSLAADNKGRRDVLLPLRPEVVEHLRKLQGSFGTHVFAWDHNLRDLWSELYRIQEAARIVEPGADGKPEKKPMPKAGKRGNWYGFHDLRRGFATQNAEGMDLFELQALMQHRSLETTKLYVNMANRLNRAVEGLYVPEVLRRAEQA